MPMPKNNDLILISSVSPILYGIYENQALIHSSSSHQKTLDALTVLVQVIEKWNIGRIFYANGPGSFTAIKLTHIFLQTLRIMRGIEIFCIDSFYFNANAPIRAFGNQYFVKEHQIVLKTLDDAPLSLFNLPQTLNVQDFGKECEPLYVLPAV